MLSLLETALNKLRKTEKFNFSVRSFSAIREPFQPLRRCPRWVCVEDAVKVINSG